MHHKRGRRRNLRAGCKLCKFWKVNGYGPERRDSEKFADHRRRASALREIRGAAEFHSARKAEA